MIRLLTALLSFPAVCGAITRFRISSPLRANSSSLAAVSTASVSMLERSHRNRAVESTATKRELHGLSSRSMAEAMATAKVDLDGKTLKQLKAWLAKTGTRVKLDRSDL